MISRTTENKHVGWVVENALHNSAISSADCYSVINAIPQGTTENTRIGSSIKPLSLTVSGVVSINPGYNPDTRVMYARVIIATQKSIKRAGATAGNVDAAHLLLSGDATTGPEEDFDGTRRTLQYPVNKDNFRVYYDKIFPLYPTSAASGFPLNASQFKFKKVINKLPAHLTFDEGGGDYTNNFAPFICVGYCYADGGVGDVANQRLSTQIQSELTFEDA